MTETERELLIRIGNVMAMYLKAEGNIKPSREMEGMVEMVKREAKENIAE